MTARNTSNTCPRCRTVDRGNRPKRSMFRRIRCGFSEEADYVAALKIVKRATFNQPTVAPGLTEACKVAAISPPLGERS